MICLSILTHILITLYQAALKVTSHVVCHSASLFKSFYRSPEFLIFIIFFINLVSPANILSNYLILSGRLFLYIRNRINPSTEPWGTLILTLLDYDIVPLITNFWCLSVRQSLIPSFNGTHTPANLYNFSSNPLLCMLSNVFWKSRKYALEPTIPFMKDIKEFLI